MHACHRSQTNTTPNFSRAFSSDAAETVPHLILLRYYENTTLINEESWDLSSDSGPRWSKPPLFKDQMGVTMENGNQIGQRKFERVSILCRRKAGMYPWTQYVEACRFISISW